jgi:hypothetical protein
MMLSLEVQLTLETSHHELVSAVRLINNYLFIQAAAEEIRRLFFYCFLHKLPNLLIHLAQNQRDFGSDIFAVPCN